MPSSDGRVVAVCEPRCPGSGWSSSCALLIVSLFFIFTKPMRQAVWDQVAKTLVVKVR